MQFILNEIFSNTKNIFAELNIVKFDKDTCFVNELLEEVPKLVYQDKNVEETRKERDNVRDKINLQKQQEEVNDNANPLDFEEEIKELDLVSTLNSAYKTIEIIGQILKNYYGSLKGEKKLELGEEAYFVGLRALKSLYEMLHNNINLVVKDIKTVIEERNIVEKGKIEEASKRLLFHLCEMISYSFISKVAQSLGSEKLSVTFKEILEKNNSPSVQLIDIAIKLDFFKAFPLAELKTLKNSLSNNYLPLMLLKRLVINYLYMFQTKYDEKQRICSIMEIPIKTAMLIGSTTTQRKKT